MDSRFHGNDNLGNMRKSLRPLCSRWLKKIKNKANFKIGKKVLSSLKTEYYVDFMPFVAEKNKANLFRRKTPDYRRKTQNIRLQIQDKKC